jgi:hypothetical protein
MIVAEKLTSLESKCFKQLARHTREGNSISLPRLEFPSSGVRQREENHTLFFHLSLDQPRMEMPGRGRTPQLSCQLFNAYCTARKCRMKHSALFCGPVWHVQR